jgi:flagellar biosynthesis GTPase FlhF
MSTVSAPPAPTEAEPQNSDVHLFRGRSIDELIPRIEAELGADAIVVRRRRGLEGGIAGFFQRPYVEVEARSGTPRLDVYDEDPQPAFPAVPRPAGAYVTDTLATIAAAGVGEPSVPDPVVEDPPLPTAAAPEEFRELTPDTFGAALAEAISTPPLEHELKQIDSDIAELRLTRQAPAEVAPIPRPSRARTSIEDSLKALGVSEELTQELIDSAIAHALPFAPRIGLARAVRGAIVARTPVNSLLPARSATVAVVGPGGSGKTSCCAALLSAYRRAGGLPASCASILFESEREQPAMLMSPHVMEPMSLRSTLAREALAEARRQGLLLLDLPALSPADRGAIRAAAGLLGELAPDRIIVALPATLGATAAAQLLQALRPLGATGLAITHADETDQIGVAFEAACKFELAPEYLLDRGRVRGGLTRIDPTHLADRLLPS